MGEITVSVAGGVGSFVTPLFRFGRVAINN